MHHITIDEINKNAMSESLAKLETALNADVLSYYGGLQDGNEIHVKNIIEKLNMDPNKHDRLVVLLTTNGGSLSPVERMINIFRHFYSVVDFIVPDHAFSAGTVMCCGGDNIFMDYNAVLGPIDPQQYNKDGKLVAALGYLDKINELIEKARNKTLTDAEFIILKDFDLAELRSYEQARDYAIDVLEKWLAKYKFKNWTVHSSNSAPVTDSDKIERAREIAGILSDNNIWKTHGRPLNRDTLNGIKLKIDELESDPMVFEAVRDYNELMLEYIRKYGYDLFIQARTIL